MGTVATTSNGTPLQFPANTLIDRHPGTGHLYAIVRATAANTYEIRRSTDGGANWTLHLSLTRAAIQEIGSIFIANDDHLYWSYRTNESSQDRIWVRRARLTNPVWGGEILTGQPNNGAVAGAVHTGMDLQLVGLPGSGGVWVVVSVGTVLGANHGVTLYGVHYPTTGVEGSLNNTVFNGPRQWLTPGTGRITPSVDIEHTGTGKASPAPHLWVTWGRTQVYAVKLAWSGRWTGPTAPLTLNPVPLTPAQDGIAGRWDGNRWVVAVPDPAVTDRVMVLERNQANSTTTQRQTPAHPAGVVRTCTLSYNHITRDLRVFAVGTANADLHYIDFVRATGTWTSWAVVTVIDAIGAPPNQYTVRRGSAGNARHDIAVAHATPTPNTVTSYHQTLAYPPNLPVWDPPAIGYENGAAADINAALNLDWIFTDPDPADAQTAWALSRQIGAGTTQFFRASDSTWQAAEVKNSGSTTARSLAAGWGLNADGPHAYRVKVWDSTDIASAYSAAFTVIPSVKVNPSLTSPTPAQVLTADTVTATWTAAEQTALRVTLATNPGGQVVHDSDWRTGTATSYTVPVRLADLTGWTLTLRTANNEGLPSNPATVNFTVDFLEPPAPTLVTTPQPANGVISVQITNPAPGGGQPALADQDLYRRRVGDTDDGIRIAAGLPSGASHDDWRATSGVAYEYRALARGVNGTSIFSPWTP